MSEFVERLAQLLCVTEAAGDLSSLAPHQRQGAIQYISERQFENMRVARETARRAARFVLAEMANVDRVGICAESVNQAIRDFADEAGLALEEETDEV